MRFPLKALKYHHNGIKHYATAILETLCCVGFPRTSIYPSMKTSCGCKQTSTNMGACTTHMYDEIQLIYSIYVLCTQAAFKPKWFAGMKTCGNIGYNHLPSAQLILFVTRHSSNTSSVPMEFKTFIGKKFRKELRQTANEISNTSPIWTFFQRYA